MNQEPLNVKDLTRESVIILSEIVFYLEHTPTHSPLTVTL